MKCLNCKHLDLQSNDTMARMGYGKCSLENESWRYVTFRFERVCKNFDQVSAEIAKKRTDWAGKK